MGATGLCYVDKQDPCLGTLSRARVSGLCIQWTPPLRPSAGLSHTALPSSLPLPQAGPSLQVIAKAAGEPVTQYPSQRLWSSPCHPAAHAGLVDIPDAAGGLVVALPQLWAKAASRWTVFFPFLFRHFIGPGVCLVS